MSSGKPVNPRGSGPVNILVRLLAMLSALFSMHGCGDTNRAGGAGSESTNGLALQVFDTEGASQVGARVRMLPLHYVPNGEAPQYLVDSVTGADGRLQLDSLEPGEYQLVLHKGSLGRGWRVSIPFDSSAEVTLELLRKIEGRMPLPAGAKGAWAVLQGTDVRIPVDSNGQFFVDSLPVGQWDVRVESFDGTRLLRQTIDVPTAAGDSATPYQVQLGDLQVLPKFVLLPGSDTIYRQRKAQFEPGPMLLWLTAHNVPFDSLPQNGVGMRLVDAADQPVPFVVRHWNAQERRALLWVASNNNDLRLFYGLAGMPDQADAEGIWQGLGQKERTQMLSILVDDFSSGNAMSKLQLTYPWMSVNLWHWGRDTILTDSVFPGNYAEFVPATATGSLVMTYKAQSEGWAYVGLDLSKRPCDFSGLDSIVFMARGNGQVQVALENGINVPITKAWKGVALDSVWRRYVVRPDQFDAPGAGDNVGWPAVQDSITKLGFVGLHGDRVELDSIMLHGLHPLELLGYFFQQ